jgi:hypothetical protein
MYVCFNEDDYGETDAFFDEKFNLVSVVSLNDGNWRHEYFNPVMKHFGLEVQNVQPKDIPDYQEKMKKHFGF